MRLLEGSVPISHATVRHPAKVISELVLLGGVVRPTHFHRAIGRSLLDLPAEQGRSILEVWHAQAQLLAQALELTRLDMRLMLDHQSPHPKRLPPHHARLAMHIERDPAELRGTGGVLRDLCDDYSDSDWLLVANALQLPLCPLSQLHEVLERLGGDLGLIAHHDGTPSNLLLARCESLRLIPELGFIDMKEQALPLIARHYDVRVAKQAQATGLPIGSLSAYIEALEKYHARHEAPCDESPFADDWRPRFAIIEQGAEVHPQARILNSVVLAGARVGRDAVVVRSVVCSGGAVRRGQSVIEQVVTE